MTELCSYCNNRATRNAHNRWKGSVELLFEVHYAYVKPSSAQVNPVDVGRCIRCGEKSLSQDGRKERLIDHHVNYPLDLTVPVCDSCHRQIHASEPDDRYLERTERTNSPFHPIGTNMEQGIAIHKKYRGDSRLNLEEDCPDCGTALIWAPEEMGFDVPYLCPNSDCESTGLSYPQVKGFDDPNGSHL